MWDVEFYESPNGECPTKEFLDRLHKKDELPYVNRMIDKLSEFGNELRRPYVENLGEGIYELRIPIRRKQFRILYFYFYQEKIVLSHGLRKEAKIPTAEIEKAIRHKAEYFSRHKRKR